VIARALLLASCLALFAAAAPPAAPTPQRTISRHGLSVRIDGPVDEVWNELRPVVDLQLTLVDDSISTPPLADDLAFFVRKELLRLGYHAAEVSWSIDQGITVLTVSTGTRQRIGTTSFSGTSAATQDEMRALLLRPTRERLGKISRNAPLVESEINDGAALVQRLLQSRGYLSASVREPEFSHGTAATDISLTITEGPRSLFGTVSLSGDLPQGSDALKSEAAALSGTPFSEVRVEDLRNRLLSLCKAAGHFAAAVTATTTTPPAGQPVPVSFVISRGPVFTVRNLNISDSFSKGARRIITAGFRPATGAVWSNSALERMQRRVMDAGLLAGIDVVPNLIPGDPSGLSLSISGRESQRRSLALYGGYETLRGPILGLEWRHVNIMDSGDTLRIRAGWEAGGPEGSLRWLNPALFGSAWASDSELAVLHTTAWNYTHDAARLRSTLSRQFNLHVAASAFASLSADHASGGNLSPLELGPSSYQTASLGSSLSLDFRDSPVIPRKGWFSSAEIEGGNASVPFLRSRVRVSWYQPLSSHFRIAANWQAAAVSTPDGISSLPIDQRVFNGGSSTVRSFGERDLGPRSDGGTPLGGSLMHAANLEASWEFLPNFELAAFADAGALTSDHDHLLAFPSDLRYALGLGLRYALPVGPLRLDYGFNPNRQPGDPTGAFHLTFGFAF